MKNLPLPLRNTDVEDLKKVIRKYKYGGVVKGYKISEKEIKNIIEIYNRYDLSNGVACDDIKGDDLAPALCNAIHAAYDKTQEGRHLQKIREVIFKDVGLCPICGIDPAKELDHHLPRSVFKPLAIYTRNLIPLCHSCNHAKSAKFGEGESGFIHIYYEILPEVDFFQAAVAIVDGGLVVEFRIDMGVGLPFAIAQRLNLQMENLNLNERYQAEINTYITSHAITLHMTYRHAGKNGVRSFLNFQARHEAVKFHRNHWRPVLLRSLAMCDAFTSGGFATILPIGQDIIDDIDRANI